MLYPILYSRTSTGAIQTWQLEQDNRKYRSISGQQDGKKVVSEWTICYGKNLGKKNETSDEEQCASEIKSLYTKKKKTKYSEELADIDEAKHFKPMLAKNYKDYKDKIDWSAGIYVECKLNGSRCIATKNGLYTRTGERYKTLPHIEEALKPFFQKNPTAILDGEVFNYDLRQKLNEIMTLVRKTVNISQSDLDAAAKLIKYYIYDGLNILDVHSNEVVTNSHGYDRRYSEIHNWLRLYHPSIEVVDITVVYSPEDLDKVYKTYIDDGQEGVIIRLPKSPYENKRSKNLLKLKPEDDDEFIIIGVSEGTGNWSGCGKIVHLETRDGKQKFDATFKGTMEQAKEFLKNKDKWLHKEVTIKFNGYTGLGIPNYAQFDYNNQI